MYNHLLDRFLKYGEADYQVEGLRRHTTVEESHGRRERREYYAIAAPDGDEVLSRWPGIPSIGMVYRQRQAGEKLHEETIFVISSHAPKVRMLSRHIRGHWAIENSQHWVLDVTIAEDASRIRQGSSPEISAAFRRMALNILQRDTPSKRPFAANASAPDGMTRCSMPFTPDFPALERAIALEELPVCRRGTGCICRVSLFREIQTPSSSCHGSWARI